MPRPSPAGKLKPRWFIGSIIRARQQRGATRSFDLAISEESYLLDCWHRDVCPYCGRNIPGGRRVGSGRKSDGGFCSMSCYGDYHRLSLVERHRRRLEKAMET